MVGVTVAAANEITVTATITDHYRVIYEDKPYTRSECVNVKVPVYGDVQRQGNAAEGALLGMIVGGLIGKGVTGKDDGAAAGAIFGGLVGANEGAKPKTNQEVIGHKMERKCTDVTYYESVEKTVYDHSVIKWEIDGAIYSQGCYR